MILAQQLILGLLVGGLYGLAAAGLSLTFGVLRVLNVAHGELLMLGGYGTFWLFTLWRIDPFLSLLGVAPAMFVLGLCLYLALFRFVVKADEELRIKNSLLIGFGLTLLLHALAIQLWTADERAVTTTYAGATVRLGAFALPLVRLSSLLLAFTVLALLHAFLARTRWGRAIRATAEDWEAARLMGIPIERAYLLAFALGAMLAGIAGALVSVSYSVSPSIGLEWTLKALIVVVLSGLGSLLGSFAAGILLGLAEAASVVVLGGPYREVIGLVLFLLILLVRPQGLFGGRR
ncbi:MAG TPA: branched-chain amino acid ABC transporter permease [Candidatus Binatia bacterium]|nr:branched-chain amino acid ABC transporter permease [Candidatus Binatia bacterium]